jgi:hypothetical protein
MNFITMCSQLCNRTVSLFILLTVAHTLATLTFKWAVQEDGTYAFSPASNVFTAEMLKFFVSLVLYVKRLPEKSLMRIYQTMHKHTSRSLLASCFFVSTIYLIVNLISFLCLAKMDPGTVATFKSSVPYMTAILLWSLGRHLDSIQWGCIALQCMAVAITQDSGHILRQSNFLIIALAISIFLSSIASVCNEMVLKHHSVPIHHVNVLFYTFGMAESLLVYFCIPEYHKVSFFYGYDMKCWILIIFQAIYGLSVLYSNTRTVW